MSKAAVKELYEAHLQQKSSTFEDQLYQEDGYHWQSPSAYTNLIAQMATNIDYIVILNNKKGVLHPLKIQKRVS